MAQMHRMLGSVLRRARRKTAPAHLKTITKRYMDARKRVFVIRRSLRDHLKDGYGRFPDLRRKASSIARSLNAAEDKMGRAAMFLFDELEEDEHEAMVHHSI
jgi:hypothetical protein